MRNLFPGHFKLNEESIKNDWNDFTFIFDTNVLLNIYRYSESTRVEYLGLLDKIKARSWLPNRVVEEYLENRLLVIEKQEKAYDTMLDSISSLKKDLDNSRQHPFASKETMTCVDDAFDKLTTEFTDNKSSYTSKIFDDDIKEKYLDMYDGRVGEPFNPEELDKLFTDGEDRYKNLIPPGYKDAKKQGPEEKTSGHKRKFGDLIIWKEIIRYSSSYNKGIIFVTDDKKEDWWHVFHGKTIGPRPELIKEFEKDTNNRIHIYKSDRFLELARINLGQDISSSIVEEIRESHSHESSTNIKNYINDIDHQEILDNDFDTLTESEYDALTQTDHEELTDTDNIELHYSNIYALHPESSTNKRLSKLLMELLKENKKRREVHLEKLKIINSIDNIENGSKKDKSKNLAWLKNRNHLRYLNIQELVAKENINNLQKEISLLRKHNNAINDIDK